MNCYVDSSVLLRYLLAGDQNFRRIDEFTKAGSSELLHIECSRVIHRYRIEGMITDKQLEEAMMHFNEIYEAFSIFAISTKVKQRSAGSFPTAIGALDAIHLATAALWAEQEEEPMVIFTFDDQMKTCAHSMGIHTV